MTNDIILQAKGLKKYYGKGETQVRALDGVPSSAPPAVASPPS